MLGPLADWGFRAGAAAGQCKISGLWLSAPDAAVKTGIWECEPGTFDVPARTNTETVIVLSGRVTITTIGSVDGGAASDEPHCVELTAGDSLCLPKGCSVRWTVLETTRKFFTIAP
jgi:uncharacterized cupin superfamily protein